MKKNVSFSIKETNGFWKSYRFRGDQIHVSQSLDKYASPEDMIETLQAFLAIHENCDLDFDCYEEYGSHMSSFTVSGWRGATPQELAIRDRHIKSEKSKRKNESEQELEKARELLRKAGEL